MTEDKAGLSSDAGMGSIYPNDDLFHVLEKPQYRSLRRIWNKAIDRVYTDPDGAVTSARSLVEQACATILNECGIESPQTPSFPTLYKVTAEAIGIHPISAKSEPLKRLFGALQTVFQAVIEIRNAVGDAHSRSTKIERANSVQAQLAVNLAGSATLFLIQSFEAFLATNRRIDSAGRVILRFEITTIHRLLDHARNATENLSYYGETIGPSLLLVGDSGVYLVSGGRPALLADGTLLKDNAEASAPLLVAYAEGCDPTRDPLEIWWALHEKISEGSDFVIPIPVQDFDEILGEVDTHVVLLTDGDGFWLLPDSQITH